MSILTRTQRQFLEILAFRQAGETDPARQVCWLGRQPRNRWLLIVPTMMGGWGSLRAFNGRTLAQLETMGFIVYGSDGPIPAQYRFGGVSYGSTVQLAAAGRQAVHTRPTGRPTDEDLDYVRAWADQQLEDRQRQEDHSHG